jgi:hypothetical protein
MMHRFAYLKAFRAPLFLAGPCLWGALLSGCLGGELDTSTANPVVKDTSVVINPPKDSTPVHDTVPTGVVHSLFPRLNLGDKWDFAQYSGADTGTSISYEVLGDSVFGSDSVYIERYTVRIPDYVADGGYLIQDYAQTERLYLRKTDQETVRDTITRTMMVLFPGDTVAIPYRIEGSFVTNLTGQLPDTLKDGVAWKLSATRRIKTDYYYMDSVSHDEGTQSWTRFYRIKSSPAVTVPAGTFPVYEIDQSDSGSTYVYQVWFSPEAKFLVRQIDTDTAGSYADTTELTHLLLK